MVMSYATIDGRVTIPGTDIGIHARVEAIPQTRDEVLTFPANNRMTWGPVTSTSRPNDGAINPSMQIPIAEGASGVVWKFTFTPLDKNRGVAPWSRMYSITASGRLEDLVETEAITVTPEVITSVQTYANDAQTSATNAATSETNAATSATAAASSATAADGSKTAAAASKTAAATSETNAAASASSASTSAGTATTKASEASTSASNAATSASNAATSASTATTKASEAAMSASNAASSAASVPGMWQPSTVYTAGSVKVAPDGSTISRNADGTSRATFDATEQAAWTVVAAQAGTLENTALTATYAPIAKGVPTGGTTGQVLAKASNTDNDVTWTAGGGGAPTGAAGGDLAGTYPNPTIKTALNDPAAATPGLRTLGTGATQAAAGNHGHTSTSISDFTEAVQDAVAALLTSGTQVSLTYNDAGNTLQISATGADAETMRDTIGAALVGVGNIAVTVNDAGDTITISTTATANSTDATLLNRANHTGSQAASTISDFTAASQTVGDARYGRSTLGGAEKVAALSATTGTATGDLSAASIFTVTPTGNITLAFSNVPATGTACTVTVIVSQGATVRTVTPPTGTKWMGSAAPTQVANKACAFTFLTLDAGTTWYASAAVEQ